MDVFRQPQYSMDQAIEGTAKPPMAKPKARLRGGREEDWGNPGRIKVAIG